MYIYIYIYIYIYTYTQYIYTSIYMNTYIHIRIKVSFMPQKDTLILTGDCVHKVVCVCVSACLRVYVVCIFVCVNVSLSCLCLRACIPACACGMCPSVCRSWGLCTRARVSLCVWERKAKTYVLILAGFQPKVHLCVYVYACIYAIV